MTENSVLMPLALMCPDTDSTRVTKQKSTGKGKEIKRAGFSDREADAKQIQQPPSLPGNREQGGDTKGANE